MCIRYLGFLLLVWFPGALHARPCAAPTLERGYFVPEPETTNPERTELRYACNKGFKPAVEGWWATITCQNGEWSHKPQCVDERACFPPTIPNAQVTESITGWYEDGNRIRIKCDDGYEPEDVRQVMIRCTNGTWSPELGCKRSDEACGAPPKIPHALIIQGYKEVFAADAEVRYACEDGYAVEGGGKTKSVFCMNGSWTEPPTCSGRTGPVTGTGSRPGSGHGGGSSGSTTRPAGGGSSTTSGSDGRDSRPSITRISHCGAHPVVDNGFVVEEERMFLKYKCAAFYKLVGSDTVTCYNDWTWSRSPVCEEAFCILKPGQYLGGRVRISANEYVAEGVKKVRCVRNDFSATVQCRNGQITFTNSCCDDQEPRYCP